MTYGSLFSGVGGFDMGFDRAGFKCAFQCEIDKQARSVLARHYPNVVQHRDVREIGKHNLEPVDVLIGGFPCQDLSLAGQRKGLQGGTRSGLFYELARIAVELRPQFVVWENVPGLLSSDDGRDFARIVRHLGECGFHGGWRLLDAAGFGVAQQRRRVFGVFTSERARIGRCSEILALRESLCWHPSESGGTGQDDSADSGSGVEACGGQVAFSAGRQGGVAATLTTSTERYSVDSENLVVIAFQERGRKGGRSLESQQDRAYALTSPNGGGRGQERNIAICMTGERTHTLTAEGHDASEDGTGRGTPIVTDGYSVRRLTPRECERLMGWPDDWTRWGADNKELKDGPRYRLCGNGVAAPVATWLARATSSRP